MSRVRTAPGAGAGRSSPGGNAGGNGAAAGDAGPHQAPGGPGGVLDQPANPIGGRHLRAPGCGPRRPGPSPSGCPWSAPQDGSGGPGPAVCCIGGELRRARSRSPAPPARAGGSRRRCSSAPRATRWSSAGGRPSGTARSAAPGCRDPGAARPLRAHEVERGAPRAVTSQYARTKRSEGQRAFTWPLTPHRGDARLLPSRLPGARPNTAWRQVSVTWAVSSEQRNIHVEQSGQD